MYMYKYKQKIICGTLEHGVQARVVSTMMKIYLHVYMDNISTCI